MRQVLRAKIKPRTITLMHLPDILKEGEDMELLGLEHIDASTPSASQKNDLMPNAMPFECILDAWNAHEQEIRNYLMHRMGTADSAEDVLHEVFLKAMRQGAGFCQIENPRAWLFQVARNALAD